MISVAEAKNIVKENATTLVPVSISLHEAAGLTLAKDVYASFDIPAFRQSSMDGYALNYAGWQQNKILQIVGEMAAGTNENYTLLPNQASRIFTGAPLPDGADTVVMQEKIAVENGHLIIQDEQLQLRINTRAIGSEIKCGEVALLKGTVLSPAATGFLAGIGTTQVLVYPLPKITIIVTGNELQTPGETLQFGQIYESNSYALKAVLQQFNIKNIIVFKAIDTLESTTNILKNAMEQSDIVLLTGGVSVGDYDFVLKAASLCSVETLFHKIKQRPGKPLFVGKKENKLIFGLPGNPSSVLSCFYQYVAPVLSQCSQQQNRVQTVKAPLLNTAKKPETLTVFFKGFYNGQTAEILGAQESYRLSSFAKANCMIQIDEGISECNAGELVEIYLLPI